MRRGARGSGGALRLLAALLAGWSLIAAPGPAAAIDPASAPPAPVERRIAISFDDAPRRAGPFLSPDQRTSALIGALRTADVEQAAFFVTPGNLAAPDGAGGEARITAYALAGHVLANHSFAHLRPVAGGASAYLADVDRAEAWLAGRPGRRPWFRFPFLAEGGRDVALRQSLRSGLAARGLSNGYVTVDAWDWWLEARVASTIADGGAIDRTRLRDLYVRLHVEAADAYDALMVRATGRSPAHMLLLHETDLAALFLPDLVTALRARGWRIITADEAYADPVAAEAARVEVPHLSGPLSETLAWAAGLPAPRWYVGATNEALEAAFADVVGAAPKTTTTIGDPAATRSP